ncbi:3'(2'),5'-bisphosphate nucleotidase [Leptolyngbya sp. NK1-12]|uniref:3'(2'),5'-bisphosphate nucleotidase n=1 Tax=Leptolyngbya sp. NK1-12 TaxID=2547451 RepID=A0AA96WAH8_9CYAN|nr:3'(2'),5'-bisphosphate nucleotidase [Leptolyngbya sp. NK1-12]WNZ21563.1 3'(2'),5'-bisphosphate nucleotidase [Leptolyngbya sp. NK1-12]
MSYQLETQVAIKAVTLAAKLCQQVRQTIQAEAIEKRDRSPVTIADFGSQAIICKLIADAFPNDPIVAEEDAAALSQPDMAPYLTQVTEQVRSILTEATPDAVIDWINRGNGQVGSRYWTLDPIDGTKGFLRGDQYAVALALVEDGEVKVGVLGCPALTLAGDAGSLLVAVRHQGATITSLAGGDPQPIQVVRSANAANFRFVESVESGHGDQTQQNAVAQAVGITAAPLRMDSQAKYAVVACGEAALYLRLPSPKTPDYREKIWDHAAGVIVVEEAGGKVTDMHGKPLNFALDYKLTENQGVVVSNGSCHEAVLAALKDA